MERSLLIVDDDPRIRTSLARALGDERTEVRTAEDGERALAMLDESSAGVVLADLKMPGMSGLDLLRLLRQRCATHCFVSTLRRAGSRDWHASHI